MRRKQILKYNTNLDELHYRYRSYSRTIGSKLTQMWLEGPSQPGRQLTEAHFQTIVFSGQNESGFFFSSTMHLMNQRKESEIPFVGDYLPPASLIRFFIAQMNKIKLTFKKFFFTTKNKTIDKTTMFYMIGKIYSSHLTIAKKLFTQPWKAIRNYFLDAAQRIHHAVWHFWWMHRKKNRHIKIPAIM